MLIPKLNKLFIYSCNGKYSEKNRKNFKKYIKIDPITGNFEWTGAKNKNGYGQFNIRKNAKQICIMAHRAAYEMATGKLIPNNIYVCHKNDTPSDINPNHLFLGTARDNAKDRNSKGRQADICGEKHPCTNLTKKTVNKIRKLYNTGKYTLLQLAKKFSVHLATIGYIIQNKTWYDPDYIRNYIRITNKKLTKKEINEIYNKLHNKTQQQLANEYNISQTTISRITRNKNNGGNFDTSF